MFGRAVNPTPDAAASRILVLNNRSRCWEAACIGTSVVSKGLCLWTRCPGPPANVGTPVRVVRRVHRSFQDRVRRLRCGPELIGVEHDNPRTVVACVPAPPGGRGTPDLRGLYAKISACLD